MSKDEELPGLVAELEVLEWTFELGDAARWGEISARAGFAGLAKKYEQARLRAEAENRALRQGIERLAEKYEIEGIKPAHWVFAGELREVLAEADAAAAGAGDTTNG